MKSISIFSIVLLSLLMMNPSTLFAQKDEYQKEWDEITEHEKKGRYKSALEVTEKIFQDAWEKENTNQIVKSTYYKLKFKSYFEEDDFINAMMDLRDKAPKAPEPTRQILYSALGDLYNSYYSRNQYRYFNRTEIDSVVPGDIKTWTLKNIVAETYQAYENSLENTSLLQNKKIELYADIIKNSDESERRPTLYDVLVYRAINFYANNNMSIPQNEDKQFNITDEKAFLVPKLFQNIGIPHSDKYRFSGTWNAYVKYQEVTRFHIKNKNTTALLDWTLDRINFVNDEITTSIKDTLYFESISAVIKTYPDGPIINEYHATLAEWYKQQSNSYDFFNPDGKGKYLIKALEHARKGQEKEGKYGQNLCKNIEIDILNKTLAFNVPEVVKPNKVNQYLIRYKNIDSLYYKVVAVDYDEYHKKNVSTKERIVFLNHLKPVHEEVIQLKNPGDYFEHSYEYKLPELNAGHYVLVLGTSEDFLYEKNAVSYSNFQVSNMELNIKAFDSQQDVLVTERISGQPMDGVSVKVYNSKYDYKTRTYKDILLSKGTTGKNGVHSYKPEKNAYYNSKYILEKGDDRLILDNYSYYYDYKEFTGIRSQIFTDRKIYRPGQTVHFKGIMVNHINEQSKEIVKNKKVKVKFFDNNRQLIAEQDLTTNDFGSYSGSFEAPLGVNTGSMRIEDSYGSAEFSVEEYKRPKFTVEFNDVEDEVKLGEELTVTGNAKAYSGYYLDGATVQYRVTRTPTIPSWAYRRWGWFTPQYDKEILNGSTTTDENGKFEVKFKAAPDESIDEKYDPTFTYNITVDVTDLNGETHSSSTYAVAGYRTLNINSSISSVIMGDQKPFKLRIYTYNLNGTKVASEGDLKIAPVKTLDQYLKSRKWSRPHYSYWSEEEYKKLFPNQEFSDEKSDDHWEIKKSVFNDAFNTADKDSSMIPLSKWSAGKYQIVLTTKDKYGKEVKKEEYFDLIQPKSKAPSNNKVLFTKELNSSLEPGDTAEVLISSISPNTHIYYDVIEQNEIVKSEWIQLSEEQSIIKYPITEKSRGGIKFQFFTSRYEEVFKENAYFSVPYSNKNLETKFTTFRDKLRPGEKEKWTLKIIDDQEKGVNAELLASMYDASLDAFRGNSYYMSLYSSFYKVPNWSKSGYSLKHGYQYALEWNPSKIYHSLYMPELDKFGFSSGGYAYSWGGGRRYKNAEGYFASGNAPAPEGSIDDVDMESEEMVVEDEIAESQPSTSGIVSKKDRSPNEQEKSKETRNNNLNGGTGQDKGEVQLRTNFNETAFFYPHLTTNEKGEVSVEFTIPESLTKWKFIGLSHTKDLKVGSFMKEIVTQKELMVVPNPPRFFREGDRIIFSSKVVNMSEEKLTGNVTLKMKDPFTEETISEDFKISGHTKEFEVEGGASTVVEWEMNIPFNRSMVAYNIVAQTKEFSDGEQQAIPILSNRMMVTESMPLPVKGKGTHNFEFKKLKNNTSQSLEHHSYTLEFTNNPAWYAIQAMPYMMEYPYECSEQTFTRYYANSIATYIVNSNPKIKQVFDAWKKESKDAFLSNLEKNQELKAVLLEETPWVLQAKDESERKKRVALLFDLNKMSHELKQAFTKLEKAQKYSGGWPWFEGMRESRYITQHIVTGFGHLENLGVLSLKEDRDIRNMVHKAIGFLDNELVKDYNWIKNNITDYKTKKTISNIHIHYLYGRSYFLDVPMDNNLQEAYDYFINQTKKYWTDYGLYTQGMLALIAHRADEKETANDIMVSLKERALIHEELGMYWKDNRAGYYWYQAPIETQALMIEAFDEVANDMESVEELKVWLLKNKQTNDWKTTKATAEACYALLLRGTDLLSNDEMAKIKVGDTEIVYNQSKPKPNQRNVKTEAGTGYFKTSWSGSEVNSKMADVTVEKNTDGVAWGAVYWQYFEDMDKITFAETNVSIKKDLYKWVITDDGPVLRSLENEELNPGDKIKVRIEIRSDRDMEYVHMKDMRASGLEPVNVFSRFKYQDGLGYYEATKDAATHFFFDRLPKGTYVFEYELKVYHKGDFSNGITTLQCMYAPEFTSHSKGVRVTVGE